MLHADHSLSDEDYALAFAELSSSSCSSPSSSSPEGKGKRKKSRRGRRKRRSENNDQEEREEHDDDTPVSPRGKAGDGGENGEDGESPSDGPLDDRDRLCLLLMIERARGARSKWAPYIDSLPRRYDDPLWWGAEARLLLEGSRAGAAADAAERALERLGRLRAKLVGDRARELEREKDGGGDGGSARRSARGRTSGSSSGVGGEGGGASEMAEGEGGSESESVLRNPLAALSGAAALEDARWARSTVWSRAFNLPPSGSRRVTLLPVGDMLDHDPRAAVRWSAGGGGGGGESGEEETKVAAGEGDFVFETLSGVPRGTAVASNYGHKSNEELMVGYGFILQPRNDADFFHFSLGIGGRGGCGNSGSAGREDLDARNRRARLVRLGVPLDAYCTRSDPLPRSTLIAACAALADGVAGLALDEVEAALPPLTTTTTPTPTTAAAATTAPCIEVRPAPPRPPPPPPPAALDDIGLPCPPETQLRAVAALRGALRARARELGGGGASSSSSATEEEDDEEGARKASEAGDRHREMALRYRATQKSLARAAEAALAVAAGRAVRAAAETTEAVFGFNRAERENNDNDSSDGSDSEGQQTKLEGLFAAEAQAAAAGGDAAAGEAARSAAAAAAAAASTAAAASAAGGDALPLPVLLREVGLEDKESFDASVSRCSSFAHRLCPSRFATPPRSWTWGVTLPEGCRCGQALAVVPWSETVSAEGLFPRTTSGSPPPSSSSFSSAEDERSREDLAAALLCAAARAGLFGKGKGNEEEKEEKEKKEKEGDDADHERRSELARRLACAVPLPPSVRALRRTFRERSRGRHGRGAAEKERAGEDCEDRIQDGRASLARPLFEDTPVAGTLGVRDEELSEEGGAVFAAAALSLSLSQLSAAAAAEAAPPPPPPLPDPGTLAAQHAGAWALGVVDSAAIPGPFRGMLVLAPLASAVPACFRGAAVDFQWVCERGGGDGASQQLRSPPPLSSFSLVIRAAADLPRGLELRRGCALVGQSAADVITGAGLEALRALLPGAERAASAAAAASFPERPRAASAAAAASFPERPRAVPIPAGHGGQAFWHCYELFLDVGIAHRQGARGKRRSQESSEQVLVELRGGGAQGPEAAEDAAGVLALRAEGGGGGGEEEEEEGEEEGEEEEREEEEEEEEGEEDEEEEAKEQALERRKKRRRDSNAKPAAFSLARRAADAAGLLADPAGADCLLALGRPTPKRLVAAVALLLAAVPRSIPIPGKRPHRGSDSESSDDDDDVKSGEGKERHERDAMAALRSAGVKRLLRSRQAAAAAAAAASASRGAGRDDAAAAALEAERASDAFIRGIVASRFGRKARRALRRALRSEAGALKLGGCRRCGSGGEGASATAEAERAEQAKEDDSDLADLALREQYEGDSAVAGACIYRRGLFAALCEHVRELEEK